MKGQNTTVKITGQPSPFLTDMHGTYKKWIYLLILNVLVLGDQAVSQPITGVWRGKIKKSSSLLNRATSLELKLIRNGDSLTGTSYYYSADGQVARFAIRGYFDPFTGTVTWRDENPVKGANGTGYSAVLAEPMSYTTDFNCPGEGIMKLDGEAEPITSNRKTVPVHLDKVPEPVFEDEWDFVLQNFARGAGDPHIIDSIQKIASLTSPRPEPKPSDTRKEEPEKPAVVKTSPVPKERPKEEVKKTDPPRPQTVEEMFASRKKQLVTEIPLTGDTIELSFYDHAEIDGDSISLFLNNKLLNKNILLKATPFTIKLAVADLDESNELIMVAENLGSIPPNTSLMIAYINSQRFEARLESDVNSSAMIRFYKPSTTLQ